MIVNTKTGEVINPRIISHQHTHQHTYNRSLHSKLGSVKRNSGSIFAILAIALILMNFYSLFTTQKDYSLYSLLSFFSDPNNFHDIDIQSGFNTILAHVQSLSTYLSYRIPENNFFAFLNPLLDLILGSYELTLNVSLLVCFLGDCVLQLVSFILTIFRFMFFS